METFNPDNQTININTTLEPAIPETPDGDASDKKRTDYDSAWKDVIQDLFEDFLKFFFPRIHKDIDFKKPVEFLNMEFRPFEPYGPAGKRIADAVVKVFLKKGTVACIFIHIEVQGRSEINFSRRIYIYNYKVFDNFLTEDMEVISLVVLTDEDSKYRPDRFNVVRWGFELKFKYPLVKILDFQNDPVKSQKLKNSKNPMAMIVRAQLKEYEAKKLDPEKRYGIKRQLYRECYEAGYSIKTGVAILKYIDWLIQVPVELQEKLKTELRNLEEDFKMNYIPTFVQDVYDKAIKIGEEKGMEKGMEQGMEKGMEKGEAKATHKLLLSFIAHGYSIEEVSRVTDIPKEKVQEMISAVQCGL